MPTRKKLRNASSTHSAQQVAEAKGNLETCLNALDQQGEAGLQSAVNRIHQPGLERTPLGPNFPDSFAQVKPDSEE